jgi:Phycobilisome protein
MSTPASSPNSNSESVPLMNANLSVAFAQKYLQKVTGNSELDSTTENRFLERRRQGVAGRLSAALRAISAKSWTQTEGLLAEEILRHGIDADLIDPWQISGGIHQVYKHAIAAYAQQQSPYQLVTKVGPILGQARQQVTVIDPRAIGFVAMQYHYTGTQLMNLLPEGEQENFASYVKILDDHLYMPLQRAYQAAALHPLDSLALRSVRLLMTMMTDIAERIVERVIQLYPRYRCYSGLLSSSNVRTSSVRDVEMFQVYMWVCLLEGNLQALQEELFPLCVMIYPTLNVSWELVSLMTSLLRKEIGSCLPLEQATYCEPYYEILKRMFSPEVFPNA